MHRLGFLSHVELCSSGASNTPEYEFDPVQIKPNYIDVWICVDFYFYDDFYDDFNDCLYDDLYDDEEQMCMWSKVEGGKK